ncbi:unnamed protein product [Phytophthora fragariaefolia]|uniref:Unnamed protein product n=1 Tax=Phytophthora fragariaefolia TaxID=1490495 RepID=A0A9W6U777_9STRA|nr:unnamed protein product [Phytophthora fragariaefolia]
MEKQAEEVVPITEAAWREQAQRYATEVPEACKEATRTPEAVTRLGATVPTGQVVDTGKEKRGNKKGYRYLQQSSYGDVELRADADGRAVRVGQLRAMDSGNPSCLPTALLALTTTPWEPEAFDDGPYDRHSAWWQSADSGPQHRRPTRELPARKALGTWIPVEDDMQILSFNGELKRARVAEWVATLRKEDAVPLKNEEQLDIGEMEAADRDLVVTLLRQYADIVEKKEGCPHSRRLV